MLRTSSKKYYEPLHKFILERIEFEDAPYPLSDRQKVEYLLATCKQESGRCDQNTLAAWIQGLPSCINIPFANYEIIELAEWLHGCKIENEDKVLEKYWNHMAFHILKLHSKMAIE